MSFTESLFWLFWIMGFSINVVVTIELIARALKV